MKSFYFIVTFALKLKIMLTKNDSIKITLSLLWTVVMFFMVFADIFSIIVEIELGNTIQIPIEVKSAMLIAAFMVAIPILMIIMSWVLTYKFSRISNIITGIFTILFVIGGGSIMPYYLVIASFEVLLLITIIIISYKWSEKS
ncbi:DUF6326 family protein [Tenacibaculum sp. ZS6-P6]|uniref:DUF6326 family protein n=1 Tax=Tenacibaculum sp. ZS6-P6 TaxID=3447503 RepID=UPI003F98D0C0